MAFTFVAIWRQFFLQMMGIAVFIGFIDVVIQRQFV